MNRRPIDLRIASVMIANAANMMTPSITPAVSRNFSLSCIMKPMPSREPSNSAATSRPQAQAAASLMPAIKWRHNRRHHHSAVNMEPRCAVGQSSSHIDIGCVPDGFSGLDRHYEKYTEGDETHLRALADPEPENKKRDEGELGDGANVSIVNSK